MTVLRGDSMYFGEFKNSAKYTEERAAKQCALYLYALLYYFRVLLGRPVKAVFGFWVCGCSCFGDDTNMYAVGLIRLSAPDRLGSLIVPNVFSQFYSTNDDSGIQSLVHFLKNGKVMELGNSDKAIEPSLRIPALLTLPETLWGSPLVVANETSSMVCKGYAKDMLGLLDQFAPPETLVYPGSFLPAAKALFFNCSHDKAFYLKIRLKNTTLRENPLSAVAVIAKRANDCFRELYCIDPVGDPNFCMFLMNDCGTVLHRSKEFSELSFDDFRNHYQLLWDSTISMCEFFLHGDALPHNIVYNAECPKLVFIDLDEGTHGISAPKRVISHDAELLYENLRYPNYLRDWKNRVLYTQVQLAVSFLETMTLFEESMFVEQDQTFLQDVAEAADSFLKSHDNKPPSTATLANIDESVKQLVATLDEIIHPFSQNG